MFTKRTTDAYFEIIAANHKAYLDANMVTHLHVIGAENKQPLIDRYLQEIHHFRELEKTSLDESIKGLTNAEKAGRGAFSALLGMGIGGLVFAGEQKVPSGDLFGAKAAVQGAFAGGIGLSCSTVIYKLWNKSTEKPTEVDFNACKDQMQKAGFTDERYHELSAELVKLFHYRECLLLGLLDENKSNMRQAFRKAYFPTSHDNEFNDEDFNLAIEVYFLNQLNSFFSEAFQEIYAIHKDAIVTEQTHPFIKWFKQHFESIKKRQEFTQQLQLHFMHECMKYLLKEKDAPTFMARHPYFMDTVAGLIAASIVVGVLAATVTVIPLFGLIGIALVAACLAAVASHLTVKHSETLHYQRDKNNRDAIDKAYQSIGTEQKRLTALIDNVAPTTCKDLKDLKQFDDSDETSLFTILGVKSKSHVAIGGVRAWIREFARRFRESEFIQIDLSDRIKHLIADAHDQTELFQKELWTWTNSLKPKKSEPEIITQCIRETRAYLLETKNQPFIMAFELVPKVKEQWLEMIGHVPLKSNQPLPASLIKFYTDSIQDGGLGGVASDLDEVRRLAPVLPEQQEKAVSSDVVNHPYQLLLETALAVDLKLSARAQAQAQAMSTDASPELFILEGDGQYRKILGLAFDPSIRLDDQIQAGSIQDYLLASFDFLCSLNHYDANDAWQKPFQNHDEFIMYRMLLLKQLANWADPNNPRVNKAVKEKINTFVLEKLHCDPDIVFDDILNQGLLIQPANPHQVDVTIESPLGEKCSILKLESIADAIRVDIGYVSSALCPRDLIGLEARSFLTNNKGYLLFAYNTAEQLVPQFNQKFYDAVQQAIEITQNFVNFLQQRDVLQETGSVRIYKDVIVKEIDELKGKINRLIVSARQSQLTLGAESLQKTIQALKEFQTSLQSAATVAVVPPLKSDAIVTHAEQPRVISPQVIAIQPDNGGVSTSSLVHQAKLEGSVSNHSMFTASTIATPLATPTSSFGNMHLAAFMEALAKFAAHEQQKADAEAKGGLFSKPIDEDQKAKGHRHSRKQKIEAANKLHVSLQQLNQGRTITTVWKEGQIDAIYTENEHLKAIINKYLKKLNKTDLESLFCSTAATAAVDLTSSAPVLTTT